MLSCKLLTCTVHWELTSFKLSLTGSARITTNRKVGALCGIWEFVEMTELLPSYSYGFSWGLWAETVSIFPNWCRASVTGVLVGKVQKTSSVQFAYVVTMLQNTSRSMARAGPLFQSSTWHWYSRDRGFTHLPLFCLHFHLYLFSMNQRAHSGTWKQMHTHWDHTSNFHSDQEISCHVHAKWLEHCHDVTFMEEE